MPLGANKAAIMGVAGTAATGDVVLLSTQTASSDASISFTSGIDSTYGEYIFRFYNINPETTNSYFAFQVNASGQSGYNETMTSTNFWASHNEGDTSAELIFDNTGTHYAAQETDFQSLTHSIQNDADASLAGELHIFNPSSGTYVTHFYSTTNTMGFGYSINTRAAGYINVTTAIDDIQFKMSAGDFDGKIKMWGVK